jgi:peptidyl-prolyl cis-trans isomerase-like 4
MSVLLETSLGNITLDLYVDECKLACTNFLKLCKIKYYNGTLFHNVQRDFLVTAGDPTHTGNGGSSIWGFVGFTTVHVARALAATDMLDAVGMHQSHWWR